MLYLSQISESLNSSFYWQDVWKTIKVICEKTLCDVKLKKKLFLIENFFLPQNELYILTIDPNPLL